MEPVAVLIKALDINKETCMNLQPTPTFGGVNHLVVTGPMIKATSQAHPLPVDQEDQQQQRFADKYSL